MQVISGYDRSYSIRFVQRLRLYHLTRPSVKKWRDCRHGKKYETDTFDRWVLDSLKPKKLTAVDCAGWYFNDLGIPTHCIESDEIAKYYHVDCNIEPDLFTHRPTYIDSDSQILFKNPWFLRYARLEDFQFFLDVWATSDIVLNFDPKYVQHNHLKYRLIDIVNPTKNLDIQEIDKNLWLLQKSKLAC